MGNSIFITGTDTGVGKTLVAGFLARYFTEKGLRTTTQKWVETGREEGAESDLTPYIFKYPSSPHLAARLEERSIDPGVIKEAHLRLRSEFDLVIVEGTGGFLVPINDEETIGDLVRELLLPVLIVAENRLGAINQTLLTVEALRARRLSAAGIVFNRLSAEGEELILEDNLRIVEKLTGVKILGELPFRADIDKLYDDFRPIAERILASIHG